MAQAPKSESKSQVISQIIYVDPNFRHTILWVSRHPPLEAQIARLKEKLGAIRVVQVSGIIPNAEYVVGEAKKYNADIIVPVLPLSFVARLAELSRRNEFTILFARMEEIHRGSREDAERLVVENPATRTAVEYSGGVWRVWEFKGFDKLVKVEIVTEPW